MKEVSIALLGCGTVGKGVVDLLTMNGPSIEEQLNTKINIKRILIRDLQKYEKMELPETIQLTTDFADIINDDEIEIVVEVMGSADFAKDCIEQCFKKGKSVVSANKDLIADYGIPLLKLSKENNVDFQFEASVAGGIPIVRPMYSSLNSNRIEEIIGIMNGTTNYILSNMTETGMSYEDALKGAQEKGYAEADPTNDVSGYDAARKIAILATLGFHSAVTFNDVNVEGIEKIAQEDIQHATEMGYVIKLLAIARQDRDGITLNVHPSFIRKGHPLANVGGAYNAVYVRGNCVGDIMMYGQGAGSLPTASAVVSDVMNVILHCNINITGSRVSFLVSSLFTKQYDRIFFGLQDKLHVPYRIRLIPGGKVVLKAAEDAGALGATISGSGSTLIAFATKNEEAIMNAMVNAFRAQGIESTGRILKCCNHGAQSIE